MAHAADCPHFADLYPWECDCIQAPKVTPVAPSPAALQRKCDEFNARYPVGQQVTLRKDDGKGFLTVTRSTAQVLSGHSAVIWVDGVAGCYLLDRVIPMTGAPA